MTDAFMNLFILYPDVFSMLLCLHCVCGALLICCPAETAVRNKSNECLAEQENFS